MARPDPARLLASLLLLSTLAALLHLRGPWSPTAAERTNTSIAQRLQSAEDRLQELRRVLELTAARVASWPEARAALRRDSGALAKLFSRLEAERDRAGVSALALHDTGRGSLAWAGPAVERRLLGEGIPSAARLFLVSGSVSTVLVAAHPVREGDRVLGLATAELPLAVRRHIRNAFLADFDRLAGGDEGLEVRYAEADAAATPAPPDPRIRVLRGPDGSLLASVSLIDDAGIALARRVALRWRWLLSSLAGLALAAWTFALPTPWRLAAGATLLRWALLILSPPFAAPDSPLAGPEIFSSPALGPLLRSPLDLLLTASWLLMLAGVRCWYLAGRSSRPRGLLATVCADFAAIALAALLFRCVEQVSQGATVSIDDLSAASRSVAVAALQVGLLVFLTAGSLAIAGLVCWSGPLAPRAVERALRIAAWPLGLAFVAQTGLRPLAGWNALPILGTLAVAGFLGLRLASGFRPRFEEHGRIVLGAASFAALLGAILAFELSWLATRSLREEIQTVRAPRVLRQPEWRRSVLSEAQRRIDALDILEQSLPGPQPPLLEELAFSIWSGTELAATGLPSAVEIGDGRGALISRFALSLPASSAPGALPESDEWVVTRDALPLASAKRFALHARRRLLYHGEVHGAVHVYVADDLLALPATSARDPYSVLFRSAPEDRRSEAVELIAWDLSRAVPYGTAEQAPALGAATVARVRESAGGFWSGLAIDGAPYEGYFFGDRQSVFAIAYPRRTAWRQLALVVEASAAAALSVLVVVLATLLLRSLLGRAAFSLAAVSRAVGGRFLLRLFVAFVAVALLPVVVLQTFARGFVADRLARAAESEALSLAAVAKKAVEDFAFFQEGEAPGNAPVTDAALVWVASLIRNDLDVFEAGRLLASSKRELYASGLLPPRVSGTVYRDLVLVSRPSALVDERIGALAYRVVSVPLALGAGPPAILSIPLALRERENQAVLDDLDRSIRLASILFLFTAALIARAMARRISEPLRDLTEATRRVAQGDLSARVSLRSRDELAALETAFNQMAADLETQRRDLERSNRRAAWADMARQVAHEVKNPLTPIQLAAEHLRRVFADSRTDFGPTLDACTRTILDQVRQLRGMVTEFSAFARPPVASREATSLADVVRAATRPYLEVLPPGVTLEVAAPLVAPVSGDRRLLERAVVNLVENALQAVGEKGSIRVEVAGRADAIEVCVEDDGVGMTPEIRARAFEPFFSTRQGGSGLGLPLVRKIAEDHGGSVALEVRGGRTRVVLRVPVSTAGA